MDFLDSLDLDVPKYKKSRRVRSWYLYEQFKSLERNQIDAARQLMNRSYQDKILQQELSERKARRKLYDQYGLSQSESGIENIIKSDSTNTSLNVSNDDFLESFHELQEDGLAKIVVQDLLDDYSEEDQQTEHFYDDDFKTIDDAKDDSCAETVNSVINVKSVATRNANDYVDVEQETKFDEVVVDFDEVTEKLHCLERLTQLKECDRVSETGDSQYSVEAEENQTRQIIMKDKKVNTSTTDKNIYFMWSRLVSFASQVMQLNHGNCYHDYGSQFLTAVLACDVLRRGINRMCDILQLYVSPIKFATDTKPADENNKNVKRRNPIKLKRFRTHEYKRYYPSHSKFKTKTNLITTSKHRLDNFWEEQDIPFSVKHSKNCRKDSTSGQWSISKVSMNKRNPTSKCSYHSIWPISSGSTRKTFTKQCTCSCHKVENPMLRLSTYLDRLMRDIDDPLFM